MRGRGGGAGWETGGQGDRGGAGGGGQGGGWATADCVGLVRCVQVDVGYSPLSDQEDQIIRVWTILSDHKEVGSMEAINNRSNKHAQQQPQGGRLH